MVLASAVRDYSSLSANIVLSAKLIFFSFGYYQHHSVVQYLSRSGAPLRAVMPSLKAIIKVTTWRAGA